MLLYSHDWIANSLIATSSLFRQHQVLEDSRELDISLPTIPFCAHLCAMIALMDLITNPHASLGDLWSDRPILPCINSHSGMISDVTNSHGSVVYE